MTGEINHDMTIVPMTGQDTTENPAATMPAPTTPPTTEWVVETGARRKVAMWIHIAEASPAELMTRMKSRAERSICGLRSLEETVVTTSPPASRAPEASHTAAMASAPVMVSARPPTAGPMLLATSLAPTLSAI